MNHSFYSAAVGAGAQQAKLDILGNNMANISTYGFKHKKGVFADLIYTNINAAEDEVTNLKSGSGARLQKADTDFRPGQLIETRMPYDFAIKGAGFFEVLDTETNTYSYTRDGNFILSRQAEGQFYLASNKGKLVMSPDRQPILVENDRQELNVGVFDFVIKEGMEHMGANEFMPIEKNGQPVLLNDDRPLERGFLESSNVEMEDQFARIIESQRAFQYALKMIQTSDEIETVINSLRQ